VSGGVDISDDAGGDALWCRQWVAAAYKQRNGDAFCYLFAYALLLAFPVCRHLLGPFPQHIWALVPSTFVLYYILLLLFFFALCSALPLAGWFLLFVLWFGCWVAHHPPTTTPTGSPTPYPHNTSIVTRPA